MRLIERIKSFFSTTKLYMGAQRVGKVPYRFLRWIRGDYTLKNSELLFSAVSRIANALSAMPVRVYKGSKVYEGELNDMIAYSPNASMTTCNWLRTMEACRCTYGNAYAIKTFDETQKLTGLEILDPSKVKPFIEPNSKELWYRITPDEGPSFDIHNFYIFHVAFLSTNGYEGINPVSVLLNTLSYNDEIQAFGAAQLEKGINAQIVIEAPANLGESQKAQTIEALRNTWKKTNGNLLLLESGLSAKTLNLSPIDTKTFEIERISRSRVAMVYNLPPHLMGDYSDTSFSSQEQQTLEFLTLTMTPIVTIYEQEFMRKIILSENRKKGLHVEFDMEAILRADSATKADVYQKAIRGGWMRPNEVRSQYNLAPDPNGNELLVSRDLIPLGYLCKNPSLSETQNSTASAAPSDSSQETEGKESG